MFLYFNKRGQNMAKMETKKYNKKCFPKTLLRIFQLLGIEPTLWELF